MSTTSNPYSYKNIWKIAFPIILGSVAQDIITIVDTAFVGRLGEEQLGAAAIGGIFYLAIVMLAWGFGLGVQIIIARRFGENNLASINKILHHSFIVLISMALTVFTILRIFNPLILAQLIELPSIFEYSLSFMNIRIFGLFAAFININFRAFYIGTSNTKIIGHTTILMALVNISLDYLFIFGFIQIPAMGIKGAALASVIAEYFALLYFILYSIRNRSIKKFELFKREKFNFHLMKRIFKVSSPTTIQHFVSFSAWFLFFIFVEKMGKTPLAVSNIIRSLYIILILPIMGFASATNTLVSYAIGKNQLTEIAPIIKKTLSASLSGILAITIICSLIPEYIISLFTNIPELITATIPVYYVVMGASFTLCTGFILFQAVSGTGSTLHALIIEIVVITFYMLGVYIIVNVDESKIQHVWMMEILYGFSLSVISLWYLKFGNWQNKKV